MACTDPHRQRPKARAISAEWAEMQAFRFIMMLMAATALALALTAGLPARAGSGLTAQQIAEAGITAEDRTEIEATIRGQMAAFLDDDADRAFDYATPSIRARFVTAERFMTVVRRAYRPVYRPQSVEFQELEAIEGRFALQSVAVIGPTGVPVMAFYQMERQADGGWRIAGCFLTPVSEEAI